jgi:hypothetical protein
MNRQWVKKPITAYRAGALSTKLQNFQSDGSFDGTQSGLRELAYRFISNQQEKTMHSRWEAAIPQAMQQHGGRNRAPVARPAPSPAIPEPSQDVKQDDVPAEEPEGSKAPVS